VDGRIVITTMGAARSVAIIASIPQIAAARIAKPQGKPRIRSRLNRVKKTARANQAAGVDGNRKVGPISR